MAKRGTRRPKADPKAEAYDHIGAEALLRPEIGLQAQFKQKRPPKTYRYFSSLSPALDWDGQNPARERGEAQIAEVEKELGHLRKKLASKPDWKEHEGCVSKSEEAIRSLKAMSKPFLNWAGKAERLSFDVATLPLFVHERLSSKYISL